MKDAVLFKQYESRQRLRPKSILLFPLDTSVCASKGGFSAYAISTRISCTGPFNQIYIQLHCTCTYIMKTPCLDGGQDGGTGMRLYPISRRFKLTIYFQTYAYLIKLVLGTSCVHMTSHFRLTYNNYFLESSACDVTVTVIMDVIHSGLILMDTIH